MLKQILILFVLITGVYSCNDDKPIKQPGGFSKRVWRISRDIAAGNIMLGGVIGPSARTPEQWTWYEKLDKIATDTELVLLSNDTSAVIRCYAFLSILNRPHIDAFSIMYDHLADTDTVVTLFGCIMDDKRVRDLFVRFLSDEARYDGYPLNAGRRMIVDSLYQIVKKDVIRYYQTD